MKKNITKKNESHLLGIKKLTIDQIFNLSENDRKNYVLTLSSSERRILFRQTILSNLNSKD